MPVPAPVSIPVPESPHDRKIRLDEQKKQQLCDQFFNTCMLFNAITNSDIKTMLAYVKKVGIHVKSHDNLSLLEYTVTNCPVGNSDGHIEIIKTLVELGANIHATNQYRMTLLDIALHNQNNPVAVILLAYKIDPNNNDMADRTSLMIAVDNNSDSMVEILLNFGAKSRGFDACGDAPIHIAVRNNNVRITTLLIQKRQQARVNINSQNQSSSSTPLHIAAENGFVEIAKLLIGAYAARNIKDCYDRRPIDIASEKGYHEIVTLLIPAYGD